MGTGCGSLTSMLARRYGLVLLPFHHLCCGTRWPRCGRPPRERCYLSVGWGRRLLPYSLGCAGGGPGVAT